MSEGKRLGFLILCILLFVRPLICGLTYAWSNSIFQIGVITVFALIILPQVWNGRIIIRRTFLDFILIGFFLSLLLCTIFTVNIHRSITFIYQWFQYIILYFAVVQISDNENARKTLLTISMVVLFIVSIYGVYQYFWGFEITREYVRLHHKELLQNVNLMARLMQNRVFSTFVHAPAFAGYLVLMLPVVGIAVFSFDSFFKRFKVLWIFILLISVYVLLLTFSKGGWIVAPISLLLFFILMGWKQILKFKVWILVFLSVVFIILSGFLLWKKPSDMPGVYRYYRSAQVRIEYWRVGFLMFKDRPILGFGPGTFGAVFPTYKSLEGEETQLAHNSFVQVASECGIVGLVMFSLIWAVFLFKGFSIAKKNGILGIGLYTSIFAFIFHGMGDFNLYVPGIVFLVFLLLGIFARLEERKTFTINTKPKDIINFLGCLSIIIFLIFILIRPMLGEIIYETVINPIDRSLKLQDFNLAISRIKIAISYDPLRADYHFALAQIYERQFDIGVQTEKRADRTLAEQALKAYKQAVRLDPYMPFYHFALGRMYLKTSHWDERRIEKAIEKFKTAIKRYPTKARYYQALADVLISLKRYEEAEYYLKQIERLKR
ncbi:hypothetical protein B9J78_05795 [bacterium Unc6]|nr:hypothetical protein [bacterium Unc6]